MGGGGGGGGDTDTKRVCLTVSVEVKYKNACNYLHNVLAGDQWWPRTSGGRLRFAHAITHLLRHRFGHFVNSNK